VKVEKVVTVKYKGAKKGGMHVTTPIGVNNKSSITGTILLNPTAELTKEDAEKLVELDPANFEIEGHAKKHVEHVEHAEEHAHLETHKTKKKAKAKLSA
jgi:hypothetical protein